MHDVVINGRARKVAASWNELTRPQLLQLMPILYGRYPDARRQRIDALWVLLGIGWGLGMAINPVQYCQILPLTNFLFGELVGLTAQLLPWVRGRWYQRKLYGPSAGLGNVRFLEFVFADSYFVAYAQSQDMAWLHKLLAVLYRPQRARYRPKSASYGGDRRADFNENLLDERLAEVVRLPEAVQLAIVTWYRGCRHALEQRYTHVFTPENEEAATESSDGWAHVLREMSGQAFGDFEQTGRQHLHTVLAKLNDDIKRALELKRQAEAQKATY